MNINNNFHSVNLSHDRADVMKSRFFILISLEFEDLFEKTGAIFFRDVCPEFASIGSEVQGQGREYVQFFSCDAVIT